MSKNISSTEQDLLLSGGYIFMGWFKTEVFGDSLVQRRKFLVIRWFKTEIFGD